MSICMSCGTTHDCRGHNQILVNLGRLKAINAELLAALKGLIALASLDTEDSNHDRYVLQYVVDAVAAIAK